MGISGNWNVQYYQGAHWLCACDWQSFITNGVYYIAPLGGNSWQVGGNN